MTHERQEPETHEDNKHPRFLHVPDRHPYPEPEPYQDGTSRFEQDDRGDGMGVDDEKTYHRTEK
jgi:hypothetical protein